MISPQCWLASAAVALAACQTPAAQRESAALIVDADASSRAALQTAVSKMLGLPAVALADDALTQSSVLTIERNLRITGRELGKPETFRLITHGKDCVLVHARDDQRIGLPQIRCRPA